MQLYFLSFLSSSLFFLEVVVKIFDYFWKPNSLFSKFCVNCFWCTTSYTVIIVLWMTLTVPVNAHARWWPCAWLKCVSGPRILEENFEFFDLHAYHWPSAQINEGNWLQLLFYFLLLIGIVASVFGMSFFSCVSSFRLNFSRFALWRKRLQLDSKSDLTNGLILGFFVGKWLFSSTSYLYGLKCARIAQLCFFFDDIKFFRCLVWGVFWSVL